MGEQKDTKYQTHLSGPTQGFVQGEHNTVILVSKEPEMVDSTQRPTLSPRPLWVRLCCWLVRQRGLIWGTTIFGLLLNIVATWLVTPWGTTFANTPLGTLLNHFGISLGIGVGLLALTGMVTIVSRNTDASALQMPSPRRPTQQNRSVYVQALDKEYRKQLKHSLQESAKIVMGLRERTDVIRAPTQSVFRRLATDVGHPLPSGTSIIQVYDDTERGLLILGQPGAGKTTLLLELACELLIRAENNSVHPIPVILNLSSWASKKAPLQHWLIDQLRLIYNFPSRFSQAWLDQDQWLLLLDGLDEVEETSRQACIEAINAYREEHFTPLIVCSRSNEYLSQDARLVLSSAVVVQPLEEAQVTEYLKRLGKSMAAVREVIRRNEILRQLITTPLMLHVIILAYRDKAIRDLPKLGSPEQQQRQIFDCYVERMLDLQTIRAQFTPQQTQRWLIWLAQHMKQHHLTEFYVEWLQPSWLMTKKTQITYQVFSCLLYGLLYGLAGGLIYGLVGRLIGGLGGGLLYGLIVGFLYKSIEGKSRKALVYGLIGGLVFGLIGEFIYRLVGELLIGGLAAWLIGGLVAGPVAWQVAWLVGGGPFPKTALEEIELVEVFTWEWKRVRLGLALGLIAGLVVGVIAGLVAGPITGLVAGLITGLVAGLVLGLIGGMVGREDNNKDRRIRPNQGIQKSGWNALRFGPIYGLILGLMGGLVYGLVLGLMGGLIYGLVLGLMGGIVFGMAYGGQTYFCHYILRYILSRSGVIPWLYVRFLEEKTECILLQRVGGGYRFIHALFLDYFASLETETSSDAVQPSLPQA